MRLPGNWHGGSNPFISAKIYEVTSVNWTAMLQFMEVLLFEK